MPGTSDSRRDAEVEGVRVSVESEGANEARCMAGDWDGVSDMRGMLTCRLALDPAGEKSFAMLCLSGSNDPRDFSCCRMSTKDDVGLLSLLREVLLAITASLST